MNRVVPSRRSLTVGAGEWPEEGRELRANHQRQLLFLNVVETGYVLVSEACQVGTTDVTSMQGTTI
jgi:hypothetical protein